MPCALAHFQPGFDAKAQALRHLIVHIDAGAAANIIKEDVAAVLDRRKQVHRPAMADLQTAGVIVRIIGVGSRTIHRILGLDHTIDQRRHGYSRFECRARGILPLQRAVIQRQRRVGRIGAVVGTV